MHERRASYIGNFRASNGQAYEHNIYCHEDDRVECIDRSGKVVLIHTADCYVKTPDGKYIGRWSMSRDNEWSFVHNVSGSEYLYDHDLLKAEMLVSKLYIDGDLS